MHAKVSRPRALILLIVAAALLTPALAAGPQQPQQAAPESWGPYGKDHMAIPTPKMDDLEEVVRKQIQGFHRSLRTLAANFPDRNRELGRAYGMLGQALQAYELWTSAEACYRNAHQLDPDTFQWAHLLGVVHKELGNSGQAIEFFEAATAIREDYAPSWAGLGALYLEQNELDKAQAAFERTLAINAGSAFSHYGLGQTALARGDAAEAIRSLEEALKITPQANRLFYSLGMAYRRQGDREKAKLYLGAAGKIGVREYDPLLEDVRRLLRGVRVHIIRGRAAYSAGHMQDAAREFRKAVNANPNSVVAHINLGASLSSLGLPLEAMEHFRKALELEPENRNALFNLGSLTLADRNYEEAEQLLRRALTLDPDDLGAQIKLAEVLAIQGKSEQSIQAFRAILQAKPDQLNVIQTFSNVLAGLNRYAEAKIELEKGLALSPDNYVLCHQMARILAAAPDPALRDGKRALQLAEKALLTDPNWEHMESVALAYAELGDCSKATTYLQRALTAAAQTPNHPRLPELRAALTRSMQGPPCRPPLAEEAKTQK